MPLFDRLSVHDLINVTAFSAQLCSPNHQTFIEPSDFSSLVLMRFLTITFRSSNYLMLLFTSLGLCMYTSDKDQSLVVIRDHDMAWESCTVMHIYMHSSSEHDQSAVPDKLLFSALLYLAMINEVAAVDWWYFNMLAPHGLCWDFFTSYDLYLFATGFRELGRKKRLSSIHPYSAQGYPVPIFLATGTNIVISWGSCRKKIIIQILPCHENSPSPKYLSSILLWDRHHRTLHLHRPHPLHARGIVAAHHQHHDLHCINAEYWPCRAISKPTRMPQSLYKRWTFHLHHSARAKALASTCCQIHGGEERKMEIQIKSAGWRCWPCRGNSIAIGVHGWRPLWMLWKEDLVLRRFLLASSPWCKMVTGKWLTYYLF